MDTENINTETDNIQAEVMRNLGKAKDDSSSKKSSPEGLETSKKAGSSHKISDKHPDFISNKSKNTAKK